MKSKTIKFRICMAFFVALAFVMPMIALPDGALLSAAYAAEEPGPSVVQSEAQDSAKQAPDESQSEAQDSAWQVSDEGQSEKPDDVDSDEASAEATPTEERELTAAAEDGAKITAYGNLPEVAAFETDQFGIYAIYTTRYGNMKVTFHVNEGPDANTNAPITKTIYSSYPSYQYKIGSDGPPAPRPPEGYTFVGWSTSETERKLFDVHHTPITENVDLWAWFETGVVKVGTELELRSAVGYSTAPITIELTNDINLTDPLAYLGGTGIGIYPAMHPHHQTPGYRQSLYIAPGQDITLTGAYSIAATVTTDRGSPVNGNTVSVDGKLTLDGPTITQIGADGIIYGIATGTSVNYPDGTPTPTLIFKSGNVCGVYLGISAGNGHLEMEGGNIYNNGNGSVKSISNGGGICVGSSVTYPASATISGGNIHNNTANNGGGVSLNTGGNRASLTISGGNIYDNHAAAYYPNVYAYGGHGGGIFVSGGNYASLTITGGNIYNNEADRYGGGVYSDANTTLPLTMSGGNIYGNKAGTEGGGIFTHADLNISGGAIYENSAVNGGGIYCDDYYSARNGIVRALNISGTASIRDNVAAAPDAASYGGGIFAEAKVAMNMSGKEISGNAATYGGGVYLQGDATVSGGEISGNEAAYGGGVYLQGDATVSGGEINSNTAGGNGGGVLVASNGSLAMSAGTLDGNTARYGGGIYNAGILNITDGALRNNAATNPYESEYDSGGGIYTEEYANLTVGKDVVFSGNTANKLTQLLATDEDFTTYKAQIAVPDGKWSVTGVKYGYNNYDINYLGNEIKFVTVTFVAGSGGSLSGVTEYTGIVQGTSFGEAVSVPAAQAAEGYVFDGWSPALPSGGQAVTADATYKAVFVKEPVTPVTPPPPPPTPPTPSTPPTATPTTVNPVAPTAPPISTAPVVAAPDPVTPLQDAPEAGTILDNGRVPASTDSGISAWALINLILCIVGALFAMFTAIRVVRRGKAEYASAEIENESEAQENGRKRSLGWLLMTILLAAVGVVLFLLTEDMSLPMGFVDQWTIANAVVFLIEIVLGVAALKRDADQGLQKA